MKMKMTAILLAAVLLLSGCKMGSTDPDKPAEGQNGTEVVSEEYVKLYQPILDDFFLLASGNYDENNLPEVGTSLLEGNGWNRDDAMLWDAGYQIRDLSGDGIPELLIGSTAGEEYDVVAGTMIYALFTVADNQVHLTLEGFHRSAYCLLEDGSIFHQGSGGAAYRIFGLYDLTTDGTALTCRDYWFTHEKDGNFEDIRCWHNTTGEMDPAVSEELSVTLDEFWEMEEALAKQRLVLDLTTIAAYGGVEEPAYAENPTVTAVYGSDYTGAYDIFIADEAEYAVDVVFTTDSTVQDFRVYALTLDEITDDGYVSFFFEELYFQEELTPEKGLAVKMSLPETIPFYGITYVDGSGATRTFSVNLSGFDGSVYLADISGVG